MAPDRHELPAEITDHIISFLETDKISLKVCSLTSRLFAVASQRLLFENFTLRRYFPKTPAQLSSMAELTLSPHTNPFRYTRRFTLHLLPEFVDDPSFPAVLRLFEYVESVSVVGDARKRTMGRLPDVDIDFLPQDVRSGLLDLVQRPLLVSVRLKNIHGVPASALTRSPSLKHLILHNALLNPLEISRLPSSLVRLEMLDIREPACLGTSVNDATRCRPLEMDWSRPATGMLCLRHVVLQFDPKSQGLATGAIGILHASVGWLERLHLSYGAFPA